MKRLLIVGGGAFGREMAGLLPTCIGYNADWTFGGFLDSDPEREGLKGRFVDTISAYKPQGNDVLICGLPEARHKLSYVEQLRERGANFITVIHQSATVLPSANLGEGCFIGPFTSISCDTVIGDHTTFNSHVAVGHDARIGQYCHINSFTLISGLCKISDQVIVHPHCSILPKKRIGERSIVGVGSVVIRSVANDTTVFGNPAKVIMTNRSLQRKNTAV